MNAATIAGQLTPRDVELYYNKSKDYKYTSQQRTLLRIMLRQGTVREQYSVTTDVLESIRLGLNNMLNIEELEHKPGTNVYKGDVSKLWPDKFTPAVQTTCAKLIGKDAKSCLDEGKQVKGIIPPEGCTPQYPKLVKLRANDPTMTLTYKEGLWEAGEPIAEGTVITAPGKDGKTYRWVACREAEIVKPKFKPEKPPTGFHTIFLDELPEGKPSTWKAVGDTEEFYGQLGVPADRADDMDNATAWVYQHLSIDIPTVQEFYENLYKNAVIEKGRQTGLSSALMAQLDRGHSVLSKAERDQLKREAYALAYGANPQPFSPNPFKEKPTMKPIELRTKTYVVGNPVALEDQTPDQVYGIIQDHEEQIAVLGKIKNKPAALKAEIEAYQAGIDKLVKFLDDNKKP